MKTSSYVSDAEVLILWLMLALLIAYGLHEASSIGRKEIAASCPAPAYNAQEKLYHWNAATELDDAGKLEQAVEEYRKALCVDPSDESVREELHSAELRLYEFRQRVPKSKRSAQAIPQGQGH